MSPVSTPIFQITIIIYNIANIEFVVLLFWRLWECLAMTIRDTWDTFQRNLRSDWPTAFWPITWNQCFCPIRDLRWNISNNWFYKERKKRAKNVWPIWASFPQFFYAKQNYSSKFCSYQFFLILTKFYCANFQKKKKKMIKVIPINTSIRRTHARTDKHEFIRPFRLKPGF